MMTRDDDSGLEPVDASADLCAVVAEYPLPAGVPDADVNQAEFAAAMNTTTNTVGKWIARAVLCSDWEKDKPDMFPVVEMGGLGRAYVLRLSHGYAWRQNREAKEKSRAQRNRDAIDRLQASFLGFDVDATDAVLDPVTRKRLAEADFMHSKAAQARRQLVPLVELTELLESVLRIVRDGIEGLGDRLERELGLKPEQVELVVRVGEDILTGIAQEIEEAELAERNLADVEIGERLVIQ